MTRYDLMITEYPHQGEPKTWVLTDHKHLMEVCDQASRQDYEGDYDVDEFLEWLGEDLKWLRVEPSDDWEDEI